MICLSVDKVVFNLFSKVSYHPYIVGPHTDDGHTSYADSRFSVEHFLKKVNICIQFSYQTHISRRAVFLPKAKIGSVPDRMCQAHRSGIKDTTIDFGK